MKRSATANWKGGLKAGKGTFSAASGTFSKVPYDFAQRFETGTGTSPEELIAAAHSSCYAMQLSAFIAEAGGTPQSLDVTADVSLGPDTAGGFRITGITLTVRGQVEGLDAAGFEKAAQAAKEGCPVSKALTGTTITLDAGLA
jgi:osmotically inducible protein OsmC